MKWEQLICAERQQKKEDKPKQFAQFDLDAFDDDFLSVISSQAFRRLQDKTQVFPLDKSDFVRTRLTHSLEVSTIARNLARMITANTSAHLPEDFKNDPALGRHIASIVASAGLLHDTGNPPFGHYGEEVIRDWFHRKFNDDSFRFRGKSIGAMLRTADPRMTADFENFEGNAQGLRILSKAGLREGSHDVNLTYAVMNTLIKYPNPSTDFDKKSPDVKRHKMGYYYAEREIMDKLCTATGTKVDGQYVRHPLVYIMEAADDIAYATADLADSVKKGRFTVRKFIDFYEAESNAIVDKRLKGYIESKRGNEALYGKLTRYYELHELMRAKSGIEFRLRDQNELRRLDDERRALFETEEEKKALEEMENIKTAAKYARNQINSLKKAIYSDAAQKAAEGGSAFCRSLTHSDTPESEFAIFENWLEDFRLWLMYGAEFTFTQNYQAIMAGTFLGELTEGNYVSDALRIMKKAMAVYVYDAQELIALELSAKRIIESLLEDFTRAVLYADEPDEGAHMTTIDDRFVHMIPDNFKMDYLSAKAKVDANAAAGQISEEGAEAEKLYLRFLMVTDFISGMTDSYARNLYRITNGMD